MEIFLTIILVIAAMVVLMAIDALCKNKNKIPPYEENTQNENTASFDKITRQQTIARLIEKQNTIISLTVLNTILLTTLIGIFIFVIVKIYPYLDTLKECYQFLDRLKDLLNYPINGSYY